MFQNTPRLADRSDEVFQFWPASVKFNYIHFKTDEIQSHLMFQPYLTGWLYVGSNVKWKRTGKKREPNAPQKERRVNAPRERIGLPGNDPMNTSISGCLIKIHRGV